MVTETTTHLTAKELLDGHSRALRDGPIIDAVADAYGFECMEGLMVARIGDSWYLVDADDSENGFYPVIGYGYMRGADVVAL